MNDQDDRRIDALAAPLSGRAWRAVAAVEFLLLLVGGTSLALLAVLEAGPFAPAAAATAHSGHVWTCPMHPEVRQDHPGDCPICGMALVKEEPGAQDSAGDPAEAVPGTAPVTLATSVLQSGNVRLAPAVRRTMGDEVRTVGRVEADEARVSHVHSQVTGWITALRVDQTGQHVERGDVLLELFSRDLLQTQQELLAVGGRTGGAAGAIGGPVRTLADAARQRLLVFGVPPDVIEEVQREGRPRATVPIRSPTAGFVLAKDALAGMHVEPGRDLFTIADLSGIWVWADLYEQDLPRIRVGDRAEVRTLALGDRVFAGRVTFFSPEVEAATRTLRVRIELPNADLALRPGMWASVRLVGGEAEVLAVPYDAVVDTGLGAHVFVRSGPDTFTARRVVPGRSSDGWTEIREGLDEGEVVVATGTFLVDSESRIRAGGSGGAHAGHGGDGEAPAAETTGSSHAGHAGHAGQEGT